MFHDSGKPISAKAITVWRLTGALGTLASGVAIGGVMWLLSQFHAPPWLLMVLAGVWVVQAIVWVVWLPPLRQRRWRYDIREEEIDIQRGVWSTRRTLIPMARVQYVDVRQGPLLKRYGLASIAVFTAAAAHEIPALPMEEAERLCCLIAEWAKVADEDDA
ncbi:PH domain-containing protein [Geobacillus sp. Y412MC52]|uniref:PH domain-containing protein n=1 Tax=Geobacillus sp. (strain Y412MC52) TaxID=550542 RepID=UPI00018C0AE0|nr:PH domain-containing protein [Geobacillus sp. Y412MC52]ADU94092.1 membrane-flanked domain protein [Geobacillus sp. Y412MC52]